MTTSSPKTCCFFSKINKTLDINFFGFLNNLTDSFIAIVQSLPITKSGESLILKSSQNFVFVKIIFLFSSSSSIPLSKFSISDDKLFSDFVSKSLDLFSEVISLIIPCAPVALFSLSIRRFPLI